MKFNIKYQKESEFNQVKNTLENLSWFTENKYKVNLPVGVDLNCDDNQIRRAVEKEYAEKLPLFNEIRSNLLKIIKKDNEKMGSFFKRYDYAIPKDININFTRYGTGGSYYPPNEIIIMFKEEIDSIYRTIIHEIMHLIIEEPVVQKNNLSHWKKEGLIDHLCKQYFGDEYSMQKLSVKPDEDILKLVKFK